MVNFLLVCLQQNLQCYILDINHIFTVTKSGISRDTVISRDKITLKS